MYLPGPLYYGENRAMLSFFLVQPILWMIALYWWRTSATLLSSLGENGVEENDMLMMMMINEEWLVYVLFGPCWWLASWLVQYHLRRGPELNERCKKVIQVQGLRGKVAVVTGCNTGIGLVTVANLVAAGATVIMACRDEKRMAAAKATILKQHPSAEKENRVWTVQLDLNSLDKTRAAVQELLILHQQGTLNTIDILINNAGVFFGNTDYIGDGSVELTGAPNRSFKEQLAASSIFERNVHINHLAHVVFTEGIMPIMLATAKLNRSVRIINVASGSHADINTPTGPLNCKLKRSPSTPHADYLRAIHDPEGTMPALLQADKEGPLGGLYTVYGLSKACNIFYAKSLQKRFISSQKPYVVENMKAFSIHPGFVWTDVFRNLPSGTQKFLGTVMRNFILKPVDPHGANTTLTIALEPNFWGSKNKHSVEDGSEALVGGAFYVDSKPAPNAVSWGPDGGDRGKNPVNWADVDAVMDWTHKVTRAPATSV